MNIKIKPKTIERNWWVSSVMGEGLQWGFNTTADFPGCLQYNTEE